MSSRAGAGAGCPDYLDKLLPALPDAASLLRRISVVSIAGVTCSGIPLFVSRRPEIRTNTGEQVVLAEWFGEIANHAGLQSALPRPFVGEGSNEDGGNGLTGRDQSIMKLNSGHPRHLHVCNHAGHVAPPSGFQKILGAVKRHCNIAQRPDEARQSLSHRLIVVDDRYDGFAWQFRSLPRTTTNVPHGRPPLY